MKKLKCILLVDDNPADNFYHKLMINESGITEKIEVAENGVEAIDYLKSSTNGKHPQPDLIFLDINMPKMNGWEFIENHKKLDENQKAHYIIMMLSGSLNEEDRNKANQIRDIKGYNQKPLTVKMLHSIMKNHFPHFMDN